MNELYNGNKQNFFHSLSQKQDNTHPTLHIVPDAADVSLLGLTAKRLLDILITPRGGGHV